MNISIFNVAMHSVFDGERSFVLEYSYRVGKADTLFLKIPKCFVVISMVFYYRYYMHNCTQEQGNYCINGFA